MGLVLHVGRGKRKHIGKREGLWLGLGEFGGKPILIGGLTWYRQVNLGFNHEILVQNRERNSWPEN